MTDPIRVCVVGGAGYVGLITGLGLAAMGHDVINIDTDENRVKRLKQGHSPFHEEGIERVLSDMLKSRKIHFGINLGQAVEASEIIMLVVGTPAAGSGYADLSQIASVVEELRPHINSYKVLTIKSTTPIGTLALVRDLLGEEVVEGKDYDLVVNPEFLREGKGLHDFFYPERIIVGCSSERAQERLFALYSPLKDTGVHWPVPPQPDRTQNGPLIIKTDFTSGQMIKYASNAFLATRISFINEISSLCETLGADVDEVTAGIGVDPRIGSGYMDPGLGFGGPCLQKDLEALIHGVTQADDQPEMLKAVLQRNEKQIANVVAKTVAGLKQPIVGRTVAALGLAFKSGTNDVRNSLAFRVIDELVKRQITVRCYDPMAIEDAQAYRPDLTYCDSPLDALKGADVMLILTDWPQFKSIDLTDALDLMQSPVVVDARNVLDKESVRQLGFSYIGMGRS